MTIISKVTRKNPMALLLGIIALTGITARAMDDQRAAQIIKNMECPSVEDVLEVYSKVESEEVQIFDVYECFLKDPQVKGMDREEVSKALQDLGGKLRELTHRILMTQLKSLVIHLRFLSMGEG